jgi:hypothetical protein
MSDMPRAVFRVKYVDGRAIVFKRTLIAQRGSWFEFERSGGDNVKENGLRWSDTMVGALQDEAGTIMNLYRMSFFDHETAFERMCCLIDEAVGVGEMLGGIPIDKPVPIP